MRLLVKLTVAETKLFLRDPLAVVFTFAFPFFVLFILAGVFGNEVEEPGSEDYRIWRGVGPTDYYAPAYVGLVMASVGVIVLPLRFAVYRERGILRRYRAAGFPLAAVLGSQMLVAALLCVAGGITVLLSSWLIYGALTPQLWGQTTVAFVLSVVAFSALGLALGAVLPTSRAAQGAGLILFFVMMFISGAGPPRLVLSSSMRAVSDVLPLTHVILLLQEPWLGLGWDWAATAWVMGFLAASTLVSLRFFRWG